MEPKKQDPLADKSFFLGLKCVEICRVLNEIRYEQSITNQLLKSGTSVGANVAEAGDAESPADMLHKFGIALKEAREAEHWLKIIAGSTPNQLEISIQEVRGLLDEVTAMLVASKKTLKARISASLPPKRNNASN